MSEEIRRALRLLCPSLRDVANALGVGHDTAKGWSAGRTNPSPENRAALARFARSRAAELLELADSLDG
jgi:transcriptional regulator with XRE-family HTH domain